MPNSYIATRPLFTYNDHGVSNIRNASDDLSMVSRALIHYWFYGEEPPGGASAVPDIDTCISSVGRKILYRSTPSSAANAKDPAVYTKSGGEAVSSAGGISWTECICGSESRSKSPLQAGMTSHVHQCTKCHPNQANTLLLFNLHVYHSTG